jgi:hypothetical protein
MIQSQMASTSPDHDAEGGRQRNSLLLMAGEERSSKLLTGAQRART